MLLILSSRVNLDGTNLRRNKENWGSLESYI